MFQPLLCKRTNVVLMLMYCSVIKKNRFSFPVFVYIKKRKLDLNSFTLFI